MPQGDEEPNDTYVEQLTSSARAAVEVRGEEDVYGAPCSMNSTP